ncbi:MAG: hypothetical protein CMJ05_07520 [Pelagibacterales bacterium]|nr:hypothetical protein [Pelagibacterales bacterium]
MNIFTKILKIIFKFLLFRVFQLIKFLPTLILLPFKILFWILGATSGSQGSNNNGGSRPTVYTDNSGIVCIRVKKGWDGWRATFARRGASIGGRSTQTLIIGNGRSGSSVSGNSSFEGIQFNYTVDWS